MLTCHSFKLSLNLVRLHGQVPFFIPATHSHKCNVIQQEDGQLVITDQQEEFT